MHVSLSTLISLVAEYRNLLGWLLEWLYIYDITANLVEFSWVISRCIIYDTRKGNTHLIRNSGSFWCYDKKRKCSVWFLHFIHWVIRDEWMNEWMLILLWILSAWFSRPLLYLIDRFLLLFFESYYSRGIINKSHFYLTYHLR